MLNLYCDESCHLENDNLGVMVIGGIACPDFGKKSVYNDISKIKIRHGIHSHREIKWNKVSDAKLSFYLDLVNYFFDNELLRFRCVILPDKSVLKHEDYNQTHDDFYYKMYYYVINKFLNTVENINVYVDIKDTKSQRKIDKLSEVLENSTKCTLKSVEKIQQIRSHENSILQLADLLIGALSYIHRELKTSKAKLKLCDLIIKRSNQSLLYSSTYSEYKFNVLVLDYLK